MSQPTNPIDLLLPFKTSHGFYGGNIVRMRPNKSQTQLPLKTLTSPTHRKLQGFDRTASTFNSRVQKLRLKPKTESIEQQYITGLQDEIKYLQLELKLLQEKQQAKHGQIDQLEKFFGDGIPINENILAIKNGFNNYKASHQQKIRQLGGEKVERATLIDGLAGKVEELFRQLADSEHQVRKFAAATEEQWFLRIGKEATLRKEVQKEEEELKNARADNRKMCQQVDRIGRNRLIDNISLVKLENGKLAKLAALKQSAGEQQAEQLTLQQQLAILRVEQQEKGPILRLQQQNLAHRKRNIALQRQLDNLKNLAKQRSMQLEQKLKQRMSEIAAKMDMKVRVDELKENINRQNSLTVEQVTRHAAHQELQHLRSIVANNRKIGKYTDHYSSLLSALDASIDTLAQRKPEAKSELTAYSLDTARIRKRIAEERAREVSIHAALAELEEQFSERRQAITPLQERAKRNAEQTAAYLDERRRLVEEIKVKEKQLELIFIVKGLSFEEAEISKTSNRNIQEELVGFLKNWEKIQRTA